AGADFDAMFDLRGKVAQLDKAHPTEINIKTAKQGREIGKLVGDGGRIAATEIPIDKAMRAARMKTKKVEITDETGHWRKLNVSKRAGDAYEAALNGAKPAAGTGK